MIKEFASRIAELQRKADECYYRDNPPKEHGNTHASWFVDQVITLQEMCRNLGIVQQVYEEAYRIYDFRNSGKHGYTLKDGKIVKVS
jgi:hypothetical protein